MVLVVFKGEYKFKENRPEFKSVYKKYFFKEPYKFGCEKEKDSFLFYTIDNMISYLSGYYENAGIFKEYGIKYFRERDVSKEKSDIITHTLYQDITDKEIKIDLYRARIDKILRRANGF